jgi:hypothetical protein
LLEDEERVRKWVAGDGWQADASEAAERLLGRLPRQPYRTARALERTRQGTELIIHHLEGLADSVQTKNALNDIQHSLLFDLMGTPADLRDGTRRVPAGDDGPALAACIAGEIARHKANLIRTLNQRDRDAQQNALKSPSTDNDKQRRQLRSDHARALKRQFWAKLTWDQLRRGVPPSSIVDPRTGAPINPDVPGARAPKPPAATAADPPPSTAPPAEKAAETTSAVATHWREFMTWSNKDREIALRFGDQLDRIWEAARRATGTVTTTLTSGHQVKPTGSRTDPSLFLNSVAR